MFRISFNAHHETKHQNTQTRMNAEYYWNVCLSATFYWFSVRGPTNITENFLCCF